MPSVTIYELKIWRITVLCILTDLIVFQSIIFLLYNDFSVTRSFCSIHHYACRGRQVKERFIHSFKNTLHSGVKVWLSQLGKAYHYTTSATSSIFLYEWISMPVARYSGSTWANQWVIESFHHSTDSFRNTESFGSVFLDSLFKNFHLWSKNRRLNWKYLD